MANKIIIIFKDEIGPHKNRAFFFIIIAIVNCNYKINKMQKMKWQKEKKTILAK